MLTIAQGSECVTHYFRSSDLDCRPLLQQPSPWHTHLLQADQPMKFRLFALVVLALAATAQCKIFTSVVELDDRPIIPLTESFGFSDGGHLDFTIENIKIYHEHGETTELNLNKFGLFLAAMDTADVALEQDFVSDNECILDTMASDLPRFSDFKMRNVKEGKSANETFDYVIKDGGLYGLYFASCDLGTPVSFVMHIEMYNWDAAGNKDFMSVGQTELEALYWVMFALFTGITAAWILLVWQQRAHAQNIHYFMAALAVCKALTLLAQALMVHFIERTGYSDGWNIIYYVFSFFRSILFFTVVVLIGTGWSYMKPFLGDREKRILMVVIPLQVFANIAIIIMDEESPSVKDWFTWRDVFNLVDIICCCAILFPIVWSIKNLREAAQTDGKAARNLEKLTLFRQFYIVVVVFIYFTRIIVYLLSSTLGYQYQWVSEAANQLATLAFYVWTAMSFRPAESNPYLRVHEADRDIEL